VWSQRNKLGAKRKTNFGRERKWELVGAASPKLINQVNKPKSIAPRACGKGGNSKNGPFTHSFQGDSQGKSRPTCSKWGRDSRKAVKVQNPNPKKTKHVTGEGAHPEPCRDNLGRVKRLGGRGTMRLDIVRRKRNRRLARIKTATLRQDNGEKLFALGYTRGFKRKPEKKDYSPVNEDGQQVSNRGKEQKKKTGG